MLRKMLGSAVGALVFVVCMGVYGQKYRGDEYTHTATYTDLLAIGGAAVLAGAVRNVVSHEEK